MSPSPRVSVIVPAYNAEQVIEQCLKGLERQTAPRESFEVLVVDDGSKDRTRDLAEAFGARVLTQANRGAGAARNLGVQSARGEIVLFTDADCEPDPGWVQAMLVPFSDDAIVGVSGVKKTHQTSIWAQFVQAEFDYRYDRISAHPRTDFVDSAAAGYRRQAFLEYGGFDPTLKEAEDVEFSFRLAERGCSLVLVRNAIVYHKHPESLGVYLRRKFDYARWRAVVYARYPRKAASDTRTPQAQKLQAALAFALAPVLAAGVFWTIWLWGVGLLALAFIATTFPFARRCWKVSPRLGLYAPWVLLLAGYATGAGMLIGMLRLSPSFRPARESRRPS
jgi:glycosyltransferase involved in cell wall biosynthesis